MLRFLLPRKSPAALPWRPALALVCLLTLLWLAVAVYLGQIHDRALAEGRRYTQNLVRGFAGEVASSVHAIDLTLLDLRERWQEEPHNFAAKVAMRQARLGAGVALQVSIIGADGKLVYSSAAPQTRGIDLNDREHFSTHASGAADQLFISKPVLGRVSRRWSVQLTRRLADARGRFAGVIVLSAAPEHFMRFSRQSDLGERGALGVLKPDGHLVARWPLLAQGQAEPLRDVPSYAALGAGTLTSQRVSQSDGVHRLYAWRALPAYRLLVSAGLPMDDMLQPYRRQRALLLWGAAGVSALLALIGCILLAGLRQRAAARAALAESEFRWKYALEGAGDGVWDWNNRSGEAYYSRRWKEMLGYAEHEIDHSALAWERLIHPDDKARVLAASADYVAGRTATYANEYRLRCRDGGWKWISSRGMVIQRDAGGQALRMIGTHADIDERKRAEEAERAYRRDYDALTGLPNRKLLCHRLDLAIAEAAGAQGQVWIACVKLDRFNALVDTLDNHAGDALLRAVAARLQATLPASATVARVAGDEFALVLAGADEHTASGAVQRVMEQVGLPLAAGEQDCFLSCTVGISVYPADGDSPEQLIRHADIALRRAGEMGRNRFEFYTAAMNQRAVERLRIEGDLRHALARGELLLHYQPQVDVRSGRVVGTEALLRWRHPQLGLVAPERFIRIAEETGLIVPIGLWVLGTACRQTRDWQLAGFDDLRVAVKLSTSQLYQAELVPALGAILDDTGLGAASLDIELTEDLVMTDVEQALGIMHRLKRLGVSLSLDDFGTGYSSLSYLKRLPIDVLKIDKSFVRNITVDPDEAVIARAIIGLAHSLQMQVVAEGVQNEAQLAYLRRHHCDQIQGDYFSQPLPAHQLAGLLLADQCLPANNDAVCQHQQTVLIVDDEPGVVAALYRLLRRDGYRILRAADAEAGLALLALHEVQVVLSDQRMLGMQGTEFLSRVKAMYPDTVRIMLSGYTAVDSIVEAINSGAVFRFHIKPWDDDALRATVAEAFRYHWFRHDAGEPA